jgi:hypothetical protein
MARRVQFEGQIHEFPDNVTDEEIAEALSKRYPPPRDQRPIQHQNEERWRAGKPLIKGGEPGQHLHEMLQKGKP